jgi:hypothetical protein
LEATTPTMLRFHLPLIKPDRRFSRIRLSDKVAHLRSREVTTKPGEPKHVQLLVQIFVRIACLTLTRHLVLRAQPLSEPMRHMRVNHAICLAGSSEAKVVPPTSQLQVEAPTSSSGSLQVQQRAVISRISSHKAFTFLLDGRVPK